MEMYSGSVQMCTTYMAMFWGITLWLAVHVWSLASVEAGLDPKWDTKAFWILAMYVKELNETSWLGISHTD